MVPLTPADLLAALLRAAAADGLPLARLDGAADPAAPIGGRDADLLAGWRPWPAWLRLVRRVAEASGWRLCMAVPRGGVMLLFLASADGGDTPQCLQIDLHRALSVRALPYARPEAVLAAARHENGVLRLDAATADALWARGKAPATARRQLALLAETAVKRPDLAVRLWLAKACDAGRRVFRPPGRLVAISGPDGSGKTALIGRLAGRLPRRLAPEVRIFHTRPFLLPRLGMSSPAAPDAAPGQPRATGPVRSWLRLALAWADWWVGHALVVRRHLAAGRLVLFDRYGPDYLVDPRRRGIDLPAAPLRLLERIPRPALSVFLVADPECLLRRKGELDMNEAARQVAAYRSIASRTPGAVLLDSSTDDLDRLAAATCRHIARRLGEDAHPAGS